MSAPPLRTWLPVGLLALLPWAAWTRRLWWVCDDAWISFRYARSWAAGHGPVYNLDGSPPVEGYSDLLWVALAAVVEATHQDPGVWMPALSAATGAAALLLVARTAAALGASPSGVAVAALTVAVQPAFGAWSTGGLETMPATLALVVLAERLLVAREARGAALAAAALALLRVEGPAWVLLLAGAAWAVDRARGERDAGAPAKVVLLVTAAIVTAHTAFRWSFYGDWIANTARAKVALGPERLLRGLRYVVGTGANLPSLLLPFAAALVMRRHDARTGALALVAAAVPAYAVAVGGDYMAFGRMIVPGLPLAAIALAAGIRRPLPALAWVLVLALGSLPGVGIELAPKEVRQALQWRHSFPRVDTELGMWRFMNDNVRTWERQGRMLKAATEPGDSLVTGAIGARGYFSGLTLLDRGGLVSREPNEAPVTTRPDRVSPGHDRTVPRAFFLPWKPDILDFAIADPALGSQHVLQVASSLEGASTSGYAPRARKVSFDGETRVVLLLRRAPDDATAKAWRKAREEHVTAVLAGPTTPAR